jgi:hypothetical protein
MAGMAKPLPFIVSTKNDNNIRFLQGFIRNRKTPYFIQPKGSEKPENNNGEEDKES